MKWITVFLSTLVCICMSQKEDPKDNNLPPGAFILWQPPGGRSRDRYLATFGFSEKSFKILQKRVPVLKRLMSIFHGIKLKDDTIKFDDILLSVNQVETLISAYSKELKRKGLPVPPGTLRRRRKRKIVDFDEQPNEMWNISKEINYVIEGKFRKSKQRLIVEAIEHWEKNTCIKFKKRLLNEVINEDYIVFVKPYFGCSSKLGRFTEDKPQDIRLGDDCIPLKGVAIHEIGHAMGFLHEQMRLGASKYVDVNFTDISDRMRLNFEEWIRGFQEDFGLPYDYGSIMHYGPFAFSSKVVIQAKMPFFQSSMGQREELSFLDIKAIHLAYKCKDKCSNPPSCKHGGIPDSNNCKKCICPDGFGGSTCETVDSDHTKGCSLPQTISVKSSEQCVQSPNYGSGSYNVGTECNWHLKASPTKKIKVYFKDNFSVYCTDDEKICFHWVEIKYKGNVRSDRPGPRFCCDKTPSRPLVSDGDLVVVSFKSLSDVEAIRRKGFKLCFQLDDGVTGKTTSRKTKTTTKAAKTTTTKKTTKGCMELICSTMNKWRISTTPKLPTNKFKRAIKMCNGKLTVVKKIQFHIRTSGPKAKFTLQKLCVKSIGSQLTMVILKQKGKPLPLKKGQKCLPPSSFKRIGKVDEIIIVIDKKSVVKSMKISDLEVKVCL